MTTKQKFEFAFYTLLIALGLAAMLPAGPSASALTADPLADIEAAAKLLLASLIGIPALVAAALGILEYLGIVTRAQSDKVQKIQKEKFSLLNILDSRIILRIFKSPRTVL